jgi:Fe-S-cluster containining protein
MEAIYIIKKLDKLFELAEEKEKENREFRIFLKKCDHYKVDEIVHKLNEEYLTEDYCMDCANCCKKLKPSLSQEEITEIANHLDISYEEFKEAYIERAMPEGYILKGDECPFLENNKCSIYDYRPEVCRAFPYLHKKDINNRLINIMDNSYTCPIVYEVLEDLKDMLWEKN